MKLKPCPFCGKAPRLSVGRKRTADSFHLYHKKGDWIWKPSMACKLCGIVRLGDSVDALLEWWNARKP